MSEKHIYILWVHDEDGLTHMAATANRERIAVLAHDKFGASCAERLAELLAHSDEDLAVWGGSYWLVSQWTGLHLQVVKLQE